MPFNLKSKVVFNYLAIISFAACGYFLYLSIAAYHLTIKLNKNTDLPLFGDCWQVPCCSAFVFFTYKYFAVRALSPTLLPHCKDQHDPDLSKLRAEKGILNLAKSVYYLAFSIWGYQLLKNTDFMPTMLGGSGDLKNCFVNVPFQ